MTKEFEDLGKSMAEVAARLLDTLNKCSSHPILDESGFQQVGRLRDKGKNAESIVRNSLSEAKHAVQTQLEQAQKELADITEEAARLPAQIHDARVAVQAAEEDLRPLEEALKGESPENERIVAEKKTRLEELRQAEGTLVSKLKDIETSRLPKQKHLVESLQGPEASRSWDWDTRRSWGSAKESFAELNAIFDRATDLLAFLETKLQLRDAIRTDFLKKAKDFSDAQSFHRRQAGLMLWVLSAVGLAAVVAIYVLFFINGRPQDSGASAGPLVLGATREVVQNPVPAAPNMVQTIEHIVVIATGRLAILLLIGWAFKYAGDLHRTHAEQSVMYQDRLAALGVAQNMLNATDVPEERHKVLSTLATGYLDFEQSAFRLKRTKSAQAQAAGEGGVEYQLKHLRKAIDAIRPLVEAVTKMGGRAK